MTSTTTTAVANAPKASTRERTPAQQIADLRAFLAKLGERGEASTSKGKRTRAKLRKLGWFGGQLLSESARERNKAKRTKASRVASKASKASATPKASKRTPKASTTPAERAVTRANADATPVGPDATAEHDSNATA